MRRDLHAQASVPAFYFAPGVAADGDYTEITVRFFDKVADLGDAKGYDGAAERRDTKPRLLFLRSEVEPERGAVVSIEAGEAYKVDLTQPPNDITTTAEVKRLSASAAAAYPVPEVA